MPVYQVKAYENIDREHLFREVTEARTFRLVGTFRVRGENQPAALEALWAVGNKEASDLDGQTWPFNRRSQSVGDLAQIGKTFYACQILGWAKSRLAHILLEE